MIRRAAPLAAAILLFATGLLLWFSNPMRVEAQQTSAVYLVGVIRDGQSQPVMGVELQLLNHHNDQLLASATSQADGRYALPIPEGVPQQADLHIERAHFSNQVVQLTEEQLDGLRAGESISMEQIVLEREIEPSFWIATAVFVVMLLLIAVGFLHNTLAALVCASLLYAFSYLGHIIREDLFVFDFTTSLRYVDWNVIFLIMGMMIVIAVVENTGIFQWLAFFAYRISGGRTYILLLILMLITGVASAFLDNVTTMLLMTPITVQIAIAMGINPLALLIPEVMASNVIGVSTLVGTPTNILIGSYGEISFNDFLANLTPGVMLAFVGLVVYSAWIYRQELGAAREPSAMLLEKLAERGQITEPDHLIKSLVVFAGMIFLFIVGEKFHMLPAVTALMGATALLVWIRPDINEMIEAVDWTTLVFFMTLFIVVGGIQEVGLISFIAGAIGKLVGSSLLAAMLAIIWLSALLSTVVANIPFTAAMLPVVGFLTATVPGADSKVLFYCLSIGSAMGGNGSLIGASANMVTAGIADSAGYPITYANFLKRGLPALLITVALASIWLLLRFL